MESYRVIYSKEALHDLDKLDYSLAQRIVKKISFWARQGDPLHFAKPLKGLASGLYRFRAGDYRIIFKIGKNGKIFVLFILMIRHRREIYRI